MSFVKKLLTIIISSLFILSLYLTINSYTLGNLLQKENLKNFFQEQVNQDSNGMNCEDMCDSKLQSQGCESYCDSLDPSMRSVCRENCRENATQYAEARQMCIDQCTSAVSNVVDDFYSTEILGGVSLNDVSGIISNNILFLIVTILLGISLFFVAEKPYSKIGNNLIVVAILVLGVALLPTFVIGSGSSVLATAIEFMGASLQQQLIIAIVLIVIGVILMIVGKKKKK